MNPYLVLLCFGAGAALGVGLMAALALSRRPLEDEMCDACPTAAAWTSVRAGLAAKGWRRITPQLIVDLAPDCTSGEGDHGHDD